tara:strand:- start:2465 stop:2890 length:426 start_codon:yes stop_codon:yes gene_type:complete
MAKYKISIEVEVETDDRKDAIELKEGMILGLCDSIVPLYSSTVLTDNISYVKQFKQIGPDAMTGAQIMTGTYLHSPDDSGNEHALIPGPSGYKFQLIRRTVWTKLLKDMPTDELRKNFLDSVTAVWIHPDHAEYCWTQTRI